MSINKNKYTRYIHSRKQWTIIIINFIEEGKHMNLELINERRNNKIYSDGEKAYKIFNKNYKKIDVFIEAFITSMVEKTNINVPPIEEVSTMNGQWCFKTELIKGETLFSMIESDPDNADKYLDQMIEIHTSIHHNKLDKLPIQKEKFADYIQLSNLDKNLKIDLLDMLNTCPRHKKLCHGNFTPHNVVISDGKAYVIDWNHASQGNASADVARTYLWMKINMPTLADSYLDKFCKATSTSKRYVENWIPIVAAARIAKNNPEEIKILKDHISIIEY